MAEIARICQECGKEDFLEYRSNRKPSLYCRSCGSKGDRGGNWKGGLYKSYWIKKFNPPAKSKVCLSCGITFITSKSYKKYCTQKCRKKYVNKTTHRQYRHLRRAREKNAPGSFTREQFNKLIEQVGGICPCCKKEIPKEKFTVDHIKPLVCGGSNDISNIQPLCWICNVRKNAKTINYLEISRGADLSPALLTSG